MSAVKRRRVNAVFRNCLTLDNLKDAMSAVPVVLRSEESSGHFMQPTFSPKELDLVEMDGSSVGLVTPEAAVSLAAIASWLEENSNNSFQIEQRFSPLLQTVLGHEPITSNEDARISTLPYQLVPVTQFALPSYNDDPRSHQWKHQEHVAEQLASSMFEHILQLEPSTTAEGVNSLLAEFLREGVFNALQHAYSAGQNQPTRSTWSAAGIFPIHVFRTFIESSVRSKNAIQNAERIWFDGQVERGTTQILEVSLTDTGIGIPSSIGNAFRTKFPDRVPVQDGLTLHLLKLHDDMVRWALSPTGTRKNYSEFESLSMAEMWRGLYRVLYRASRLGCSFVLRSGLGGIASMSNGKAVQFFGNANAKMRVRPWPGTTLTLRIPLPPLVPRHPNIALDDSKLELNPELFGVPTASLVCLGEALPPDRMPIDQYLIQLHRDFRNLINSDWHKSGTRPVQQRYLLIVHPGIQFSGDDAQGAKGAIGRDQIGRVTNADREAAYLCGMLRTCALPGIIPIHVLLDFSDEGLEFAREVIGDTPEGPTSSHAASTIVGLVRSGENRIEWLATGFSGAPVGLNSLINKLGDSASNDEYGNHLESLYPELFSGLPKALQLPRQLSRRSLQTSLEQLLTLIAKAAPERAERWFWKQASSNPHHFVRTYSGRVVTQHISVYALCVVEPVIERAIAGLFRDLVEEIDPTGRLAVVTDTEAASYLVLKRLHRYCSNFRVVHPDDIEISVATGDRIAIFGDVCYQGSRIAKRLESLPQGYTVGATVACIDATPAESQTNQSDGVVGLIRWPFPLPVSEAEVQHARGDQIFAVDVFTNERSVGTSSDEHQLQEELVWRYRANEAGLNVEPFPAEINRTILEDSSRFVYGYQQIDGRTQVVRWPTIEALQNPVILNSLGKQLLSLPIIASVIQEARAPIRDLVLFVRDESSLAKMAQMIGNSISGSFRSVAPRWRGAVYVCKLPTLRTGGKQKLVRQEIATAIREAEEIVERESAAQGDFFGNGETNRVRDGYWAVFLDNAAVGGRAVREFLLAIGELESPTPCATVVFPIVNRLSPNEQSFLESISGIRHSNGGWQIPSAFAALINLRIRSYSEFNHTSLSQELLPILASASESVDTKIRSWATQCLEDIADWEATRKPALYLVPLAGPGFKTANVSVITIRLRSLLALHQQGLPVVKKIANAMHTHIQLQDNSLLTMFALEPDLLHEQVISGPFSTDILNLAESALANSNDLGSRLNALWVLVAFRSAFVQRARSIARLCVNDEQMRTPWLALVLCGLPTRERQTVIQHTLDELERVDPTKSTIADVFALLSSEAGFMTVRIPKDGSEARALIYKFMKEARAGHGERPFPCWWRLMNIFSTLERQKDTLKNINSFKKDLYSNLTWERARELLLDVMLPAAYALRFLMKYECHGAFEREQLEIAARSAGLMFENAKQATWAMNEAPPNLEANFSEQLNKAIAIWRSVLQMTLESSVDLMFSQPEYSAYILGNDDGSGNFGAIASGLRAVAVEPIGLVLYRLQAGLGENRQCTFELVVDDCEIDLLRGRTLREITEDLRLLWVKDYPGKLPIFWHYPEALRGVLGILVENISKHGEPETMVSVHIAMSSSLKQLAVTLRNRVAVCGTKKGRSDGLEQVRKSVESHDWDFHICGYDKNEFSVELVIPVKVLHLPRMEAS